MSKYSKSLQDPDAFCHRVARVLNVNDQQVEQALRLLLGGRTIPFIARYRKEITGGLNELQLRVIEDRLAEAQRLEDRRVAILKSLAEKEIPESVLSAIRACDRKTELEQLYLPWRTQRKTRADQARDRGLAPLAQLLLEQSFAGSRRTILTRFVCPNRGVPDEASALDGASDIVAEEWSRNSIVRSWMIEQSQHGSIKSKVKRGRNADGSPFRDYFEHTERIPGAAAHRVLAMLRAANEGVVNLSLQLDDEWVLAGLERRFIKKPGFVFADRLRKTVADCYRRLLRPATQVVVLQQLRERAETDSIAVFASNLRELLMAPPAGNRPIIGIDPGFRTGCKVAVLDAIGNFVTHETIYPTPPRSDTQTAAACLLRLVQEQNIELIAVGNGTGSRETQRFVNAVIDDHQLDVVCAVVSESGASIYSASETAMEEFPDLDITIRGAISIAHRLQDPLAELVKLDPSTIGIGQYQHDVNQQELRRVLDREVESCVSRIGVNLNTASERLLARVAGIGPSLAKNIVQYRSRNGRFNNLQALQKVPRLGSVVFEQASGFLRIVDGDNVLDNSAVHPESYGLVQKFAKQLDSSVENLLANAELLDSLDPQAFVSEQTGLATVTDILAELKRPGRDPRSEYTAVKFDDSVEEIGDLYEGVQLEGVVTNVTGFGAFVDIGVHHDALLHISQMADHFVSDPTREVSVGEILHVRVTSIDPDRNRIGLSRKQCD